MMAPEPVPVPPADPQSWHAVDWWSHQSTVSQLAIAAVIVGVLALLAALGWGIRRRWRKVRLSSSPGWPDARPGPRNESEAGKSGRP